MVSTAIERRLFLYDGSHCHEKQDEKKTEIELCCRVLRIEDNLQRFI